MKRSFTFIELLIVAGIFFLTMALLAPFVHFAKSRANMARCATNLRKISLGLHEYAARNNGAFPADLVALYPDYIDDEKVFDCPASKRIGSKTKPDYVYTADLAETSSPKDVIVRDADDNH
ncbi:MAG: type II secretion system protein, partial [Spirochaetales bacterium]